MVSRRSAGKASRNTAWDYGYFGEAKKSSSGNSATQRKGWQVVPFSATQASSCPGDSLTTTLLISLVRRLYLDRATPQGLLLQWRFLKSTGTKVSPQALREVAENCEELLCCGSGGGGGGGTSAGTAGGCANSATARGLNFTVTLKQQPRDFQGFLDEISLVEELPPHLCAEAAAHLVVGGWGASDDSRHDKYEISDWLQQRSDSLGDASWGQVLRIVRWFITGSVQVLGKREGRVVPYPLSEDFEKLENARKKLPTGLREGEKYVDSWALLRSRLLDLVDCHEGWIRISDLKKEFRERFALELTETAFGHTTLLSLLKDNRCGEVSLEKGPDGDAIWISRASHSHSHSHFALQDQQGVSSQEAGVHLTDSQWNEEQDARSGFKTPPKKHRRWDHERQLLLSLQTPPPPGPAPIIENAPKGKLEKGLKQLSHTKDDSHHDKENAEHSSHHHHQQQQQRQPQPQPQPQPQQESKALQMKKNKKNSLLGQSLDRRSYSLTAAIAATASNRRRRRRSSGSSSSSRSRSRSSSKDSKGSRSRSHNPNIISSSSSSSTNSWVKNTRANGVNLRGGDFGASSCSSSKATKGKSTIAMACSSKSDSKCAATTTVVASAFSKPRALFQQPGHASGNKSNKTSCSNNNNNNDTLAQTQTHSMHPKDNTKSGDAAIGRTIALATLLEDLQKQGASRSSRACSSTTGNEEEHTRRALALAAARTSSPLEAGKTAPGATKALPVIPEAASESAFVTPPPKGIPALNWASEARSAISSEKTKKATVCWHTPLAEVEKDINRLARSSSAPWDSHQYEIAFVPPFTPSAASAASASAASASASASASAGGPAAPTKSTAASVTVASPSKRAILDASASQSFAVAIQQQQQYYNYSLLSAWMNLPIPFPDFHYDSNMRIFWPFFPQQQVLPQYCSPQVEQDSNTGDFDGEGGLPHLDIVKGDDDDAAADDDEERDNHSVGTICGEGNTEPKVDSKSELNSHAEREELGAAPSLLPHWCRVQNTFLVAGLRGSSAARSRSAPP